MGMFRRLDAEAYDRQYDDGELVRRIVGNFGRFRRESLLVVVALIIVAALGAMPAIIIARGVAYLSEAGDDGIVPLLVAAIFLVGFFTWAFNWVRRRFVTQVIADVVLNMRQEAFTAAAEQDLAFYDEFSSGRIVSRITSDTEEFGQVVVLASDVVSQLTTALILVAVLFSRSVPLTLLVLATTPLVAISALSFQRLARRVTRQSSRVLGEVNRSIQEAVTGISVAKNYRQENNIYGEFNDVNSQAYDINIRRGFVLALIFPTLNILSGLGTAMIIYVGGRNVIGGGIDFAAWYLFVAAVERFWFPVMNLSAFWSQFQQGLSASERVFALIDAEARVVQSAENKPPKLSGVITFSDVNFGYNDTETVLNNFSIDIKQGESVAFVGHTGAGKSSVIKLLARYYSFQDGVIAVDGQDITTFDLPAYRQQLGIVSQTPFLFDGTVYDNIRYSRPDATDAEVEAMARRIGEGEWLETLPDGLNTTVGERGSRLSMGQRQLVALTRVLVQGPKVFVLDEATANIDPFTESQIQAALRLLMQGRTSLLIAHRLSTVRAADRIIVLENGGIIEEGSHDYLLSLKGNYAELYDTYFRHQSLDYINEQGWEGASSQ